MGDAVEGRQEIAAIGLNEGLLVHFLDIDACREGLVAAGDNDGADGGVRLEAVKRAVQLGDEPRVQRVEGVWPVECDESDLASRRDQDRLVGGYGSGAVLFPADAIHEHVVSLSLTGWTIEG